MPLGKYYCDYCDKEFQDTHVARKRHLQSSSHLRAKSLWFSNLPSSSHGGPPFAAAAPTPPPPCHRFLQTGTCPFGDSCKYSHPFSTNVNFFNKGFLDNVPTQFVSGNQSSLGGSSLPGTLMRDGMGMSWGNLPPSLQPPPEGGYPPLPFLDWG